MDAWLLWRRAIPLAQAYVRFARPEVLQRHQQLSEAVGGCRLLERLNERLAAGESFVDALRGPVPRIQELWSLEEQMQQEFVSWVRKHILKAYGFVIPRRPSDAPQPVPDDLWNGRIVWRASIILANGLEMHGVRLMPRHWEEQILAAQPEAKATRGGPGRPSRRAEILEAFEALDAAGRIDYREPMTRLFPAIRQWLKERDPQAEADWGLHDKTIAKTIRTAFRSKRKIL
jgi:hypothetical protein